MGRSVKSGELATIIPSFLFFINVSEITSVNKGPGVIPETKPKKIPIIKKSLSIIESYLEF